MDFWGIKQDTELNIFTQRYKVVDKRGKKVVLETLSGPYMGDLNQLEIDRLIYLMS